MSKLLVLTDEDQFASIRKEWNKVVRNSITRSVFLTSEWLTICWRLFGSERDIRILCVENEQGDVIGGVPLMLERATGKISLLGSTELSDYMDMVAMPGTESDICQEVQRYLLDCMGDWSYLELHCVPQESGLLNTFAPVVRQAGWHVDVEVEEVCPIINLPRSWDEYLSRLGKKDRHELRRKIRRASEMEGAGWRIVSNCISSPQAMDSFIRLHRMSNEAKKVFMDDTKEAFFKAIAEAFSEECWLKLWLFETGGTEAAAMLCFQYGDSLYLYNSGFDPQIGEAHSIGVALAARCIQNAIENGKRRVDFLRGSEGYKYDLGAVDTSVYRMAIRL